MAKNWEDYRELIRWLFVKESMSLNKVREILSDDYSFIASDQEYRLKLNEWMMERDRTTMQQETVRSQRRRSEPNRSSRAVFATTNAPNPSHNTPSQARGLELEDWTSTYNKLAELRTFREAFPLLQAMVGTGGMVGFFHYAASRISANACAMEHVIRFLQLSGSSLDVQDAAGRSALEIAVKAGNVDVVNLLLAAGACVGMKNDDEMTALQVVLGMKIERETDVAALLLANGARLDRDSAYNMQNELSRHEEEARFQQWTIDPSVLAYCLLGCQRSFGRAMQSDDADGAYRQFLRTWRMSVSVHPVFDTLASNCLRLFLSMGCTPFVDETPAFYCHSGRCTTLAALSLYHTPNCSYADVIYQHSAQKYVPGLIKELLRPCPDRLRSPRDTTPSALLKYIIGSHDQDITVEILSLVRQGNTGADAETLGLVKLLKNMPTRGTVT